MPQNESIDMKENKEKPGVPVPVESGDAALTITPEAKNSQPKSSWKKLFAFTRWHHVWTLLVALLATAFTAGLKTVLSVILGKAFNVNADIGAGRRTDHDNLAEISKWATVLVALGAGTWLANTAFLALWITFGELQANSVRHDIFRSLLAREMAWFDSQDQGISSLLTRIQTQTRELQLATSQVLGLLISDIMTSLASLALALSYSWKMTLVIFVTLPISTFILSFASRRLQPAIQSQKRDLGTASKHANASLTAIDLVKVFNGYDRELSQYSRATDKAAKHYLVQAQCISIQVGYVAFWVVSMFLIGFTFGVYLLDHDGLEPGEVLTTFYATLASFQGIEAFVPHWLVIAKGIAAGSFLSDLASDLEGGKGIKKMDGGTRPYHCAGAVRLNNVSFAYPSNPTKSVLESSSFFFPAGELSFIVGRSGSGKSTLGNIITDFYQPRSGEVYIDDHPLQTLDKSWARDNVTLIQQASVLFNDTFFNNVAFGHRNPEQATREEVYKACEAALLQSTLAALPHGLDTVVGPGGHNLSGGQKQRMALARARLRDPSVLILDEITSGLDQVTRALVMDAIREWRRGKTTIIITHDVSQINDEDFVYVMDNAQLIQKGFKRDLLERGSGPFAVLSALMLDETNASATDDNEAKSPLSPVTTLTSPATDVIPSRLSRMSQFLFEDSENSGIPPQGPGFLQGTPLGISTAYAIKMREEQYWEEYHSPVSSSEDDEIDWQMRNHHFSQYIERHFSPPAKYKSLEHGSDFESHLAMENPAALDRHGDSVASPQVPNFIFGGTDRRENISELRLAQPNEAPEATKDTPEDAPDNKSKKAGSLFTTLNTVWPALGFRDRFIFVAGLILCLVGSASTPAFSYCFAELCGVMWAPGDKLAAGTKWSVALGVIAVADGTLTGGGRYLLEMSGQSWVNEIRRQAFQRILRQPKSWFDKSKNSPSRINECLDRNAEEMRNIVGRFVPIVICVLGMVSISVVWALVVSWNMTLVVLAPLPLLVAAVKTYARFSGIWETRCNKGAEDASATLTEIMLNIRVVRALTLEKHFGNKYFRLVADTFGTGLKRAGYTSPLFGVYQSLSYPLTALVFYYSVVLMLKGSITPTQALQVTNLLLFGIGTSAQILTTIPQLTMAQATAVQLLEHANLPLHPRDEPQGSMKPDNPLPLKMNNLKFSYSRRSAEQVLRGVSFEVKAGECTAIVGPSGCGKSTIVALLMGLYAPTTSNAESPLTYGGVPYADIDLQHLRSTMAYVSQSPFLFPATIADNIAYGLASDSPYRQSQCICRAADAAGIHEFIISLPQGYNTLVGDGGQDLSGGQAQRVSIARALVRQPKILVLDEPTSALDAESADMIRHTITELTRRSGGVFSNMAIVLVTHSREMMKAADKIVVLEEGLDVEEGSYEELVAAGGQFAYLVSGGEWEGDDKDTKSTSSRAQSARKKLSQRDNVGAQRPGSSPMTSEI